LVDLWSFELILAVSTVFIRLWFSQLFTSTLRWWNDCRITSEKEISKDYRLHASVKTGLYYKYAFLFCFCQNERLYAATDDNAIASYFFEDGQPDGILTRFSSHATHMCFNSSGSVVIVGAR